MNGIEIDSLLRALTLKDLRVQCRARGLTPAGNLEVLRDRLKEVMIESQDFALKSETGEDMAVVQVTAGQSSKDVAAGKGQNNYSRPGGQNTGNFLSERPTSKVVQPPGGASQIVFGDAAPLKSNQNNYARPGGQNVGNFLSDRPSSKVSNPPGGASQIVFG
ncbi:Protein SPIRAL1 [Tetrabaena socialis]|uniref:Protein SPIRAL1 n=1 Tax=Tetrabaena socialis TaxID=47790 RepID=A0A2J8ACQ3_9CHLO|nr:Protein SPIRAL1 [Tetrabaena socialis]|eukprot:PNH10304.1 Protein SPIRAL1 [Tetrabaena socialis]